MGERSLAGDRPLAAGADAADAAEAPASRPGWFPDEFDWVVGCTYQGTRTTPGPVRNMLGANMSFRTAELRQIGGFREGIGRVGAADDVAAAVLFFASPGAGWITGESMDINGGQYID